MSIELHVFLNDSLIPTAQAWQRAIQDAGFALELDQNLSLREHLGFWPATYKNLRTGFEVDLSFASAIANDYAFAMPRIVGYKQVASFRWGGNVTEAIAAIIASAVLANVSTGLLFDPQKNAFIEDNLLESAKQSVRELEHLA